MPPWFQHPLLPEMEKLVSDTRHIRAPVAVSKLSTRPRCLPFPRKRHFVGPIEMPVYPWKLAGAATMRNLHKD
jgi:hypothetical protein